RDGVILPGQLLEAHGVRNASKAGGDWKMIRAVAAKTNAARILDTLGIHNERREYDVDPEALPAETVPRKIGLPLDQVWKTLVARGDRTGVLLAAIAGRRQVDVQALGRVSG